MGGQGPGARRVTTLAGRGSARQGPAVQRQVCRARVASAHLIRLRDEGHPLGKLEGGAGIHYQVAGAAHKRQQQLVVHGDGDRTNSQSRACDGAHTRSGSAVGVYLRHPVPPVA